VAEVRWTARALADLDAICGLIARDSPSFAALFAARMFRAADRLADFPYMGRVVPERGREELRELIVGNYRLIYHVSDDLVHMVTVHHGARLLPNLDPP
jgi:toxin ParE1/3/4